MEGKTRNAVEALIGILRCPIAKRDGWKFDAEECSMWADELEEFLRKNPMTDIRQITFTGVDERTDCNRLYNIQKTYPLAEFDILLSEKWKERGNRYIDPELIKFLEPLGLNLSLHLCGSLARAALGGNWNKTFAILGDDFKLFKRCQLNVSKEKPKDQVTCLSVPESLNELIIQQMSVNDMPLFNTLPSDYKGKVSVLLDASGGLGIDTELNVKDMKGFKVGYAGGINPGNVEEKLKYILSENNGSPFWIDMETGVRTDGWFDLDKVEDVIEKCYKILGL